MNNSKIISHPLNGTKDIGWRYLDTQAGLMLPWFTIECLEWLTDLNLADLAVFEYGCGLSSDWWRAKCKVWNGVDNNPDWANGSFVTQDKNEYIQACLGSKYDIIVIDGIFRDCCTEYAIQSISKGGYLIIDNWDQPSVDMPISFWKKTIDLLKNHKMTIYKEPTHVDWKTAVFKID